MHRHQVDALRRLRLESSGTGARVELARCVISLRTTGVTADDMRAAVDGRHHTPHAIDKLHVGIQEVDGLIIGGVAHP